MYETHEDPDFSKTSILFGGSFDPVHSGHLYIAKEAYRHVPYAEQLYFVPSKISPGKKPALASDAERMTYLRIALQGSAFRIWDFELNRPGDSFTVETLREAHRLGAKREKLYWLLGADAYASFPRWKEPTEIRKLAKLVVCARPGVPLFSQDAEDLLLTIPEHTASSTEVREALSRSELPENAFPEALEGYFKSLLGGALKAKNPYARKSE